MAFLEGKIPLTRIVETRADRRRRARTCVGGLHREHRACRRVGAARARPRSSRNASEEGLPPMNLLLGMLHLPAVPHGHHRRSTRLAHFFTARKFGMKVPSTSSGSALGSCGPAARARLEYGVKAICCGGYVKIAGMNPFEEVPARGRPAHSTAPSRSGSEPSRSSRPGLPFRARGLIFAFTFYFFGNVNDPDVAIGLAKVEPTLERLDARRVRGRAAGGRHHRLGGRHRRADQRAARRRSSPGRPRTGPGVPIDVTVDRDGSVIVVAPDAGDDHVNEDGDPTGRHRCGAPGGHHPDGTGDRDQGGRQLEVGRTIEESILDRAGVQPGGDRAHVRPVVQRPGARPDA